MFDHLREAEVLAEALGADAQPSQPLLPEAATMSSAPCLAGSAPLTFTRAVG